MMFLEVLQPLSPDLFWALCVAFAIAFLLAFSVGANDVSNSFGTSVGSRVLTVTQACILATIFEMAGACLLGYSVCDTFRRKMYDVSSYEGAQRELMFGALACLVGSSVWNIAATALKMPISGTHSIVGATIGFSVVSRGWSSIRWMDMIRIVVSWFASPLLSGLISSLIYTIISKTIIRKIDPLRHGLKALPFFYGVTIFINVASIVIGGPKVFGLDKLPWYAGLFIALTTATITILCVKFLFVPKLKRQITDELTVKRKEAAGLAIGIPPRIPFNYDNAAFNSDEKISAGTREKGQRRAPKKPRRGQDDGKPDSDQTESPSKQQAAQESSEDPKRVPEANDKKQEPKESSGQSRPPVAPKPNHLRRQMAKEESLKPGGGDGLAGGQIEQPHQFDEIDLSQEGGGARRKNLDLENGVGARSDSSPARSTTTDLAIQGATGPPAPSTLGDTGERHEIARLFGSLQIMTACFASFAHGSNDVSNAVAPLIPIWNIYTTGTEDVEISTQIWILAFGSIGICTGLWAWGRAVMGTISDGLTKITPSKGFAIELGAAMSVLMASKLGMPISTTHCKVGSLVIVGLVSQKFLSQDKIFDSAAIAEEQRRRQSSLGAAVSQQLEIVDGSKTAQSSPDKEEAAVDWKMFGNIALTWISTVPLAALASALVMWIFQYTLL